MHSNPTDFCIHVRKVFETSNKRFKTNLLSLNFEKTQFIQFVTKTNMFPCEKIGYDNKTIPNVSHTKFLGLTIDNILPWTNHTDLLINKLSTACYVLRAVKARISFNIDKDLLFSFPLSYDLRYYLLGELFP
jgi:hypothetical protein